MQRKQLFPRDVGLVTCLMEDTIVLFNQALPQRRGLLKQVRPTCPEDLCTSFVGVRGSAQTQRRVTSLPLSCSSSIWCKAVAWSRLGTRVLWLQELRWLCCHQKHGLPLWPFSPGTCLPQIQSEAAVWSGWGTLARLGDKLRHAPVGPPEHTLTVTTTPPDHTQGPQCVSV